MKNILTLVIVMVACTANAQPGWTDVVPGDTVKLIVTGHNGTIQWQQSTDSLAWTDMTGLTDSVEVIVATTSPTGKRYYRVKITNAAICENSSWYSSIMTHKIITDMMDVQIGDWFHGGIVFYTDGSGHGLIAPQQDQTTGVEWGCLYTSIPGAASLTDGAANTTAIVAVCHTRPIAASVCDELSLNGYSDWFLPAKDQLNYLYQQKNLIGGFAPNYYWSSSEYDLNYAWFQMFTYGYQLNGFGKDYIDYVRCVRSFSPTDNSSLIADTIVETDQPEIVALNSQPQTQSKCLGSSVSFNVVAS
ncbi:DUF1566 domain-containing protein, partial [Patescibacteria group bacterium]|nr:DUF1566 domain-containing protein [Patescibacteria group bacterium]